MQNSTFLVLLRPIFAPKMKTAPPTGMGSRSCEGLLVIWTRKVEFFFLERTLSWSEVTEFWLRPFFWRSPKFGWKNRFNFGEDLFFWRSPDFDRKTASIWFKMVKIWVKFVYCCFQLSKKPPSLLRNPGYALGIFSVLIFCHLIASEANCLMMHKSFLAITTSCLEETVTNMLKSEDFFEFLSTEFAACLKLPSRDKSS